MGKISVAACTFPFLYAHDGLIQPGILAEQLNEIGYDCVTVLEIIFNALLSATDLDKDFLTSQTKLASQGGNR